MKNKSTIFSRICSAHTFAVVFMLILLSSCASHGRRYGVITDEAGNPIEGANVSFTQEIIIPRPADGTTADLWTTKRVTNANGEYKIPWWVDIYPVGDDANTLVINDPTHTIYMKVEKKGYEYSRKNKYKSAVNIDVILRKKPIVLPKPVVIRRIESVSPNLPVYGGKRESGK